jgi:23S rRNA pseudouridine1911/1915/1917 synthase
LKHPVVGDEVYGSGRDKTIQDARLRAHIRKLGRHFLHAEQLGFVHPETAAPMRFTAPLPPELLSLVSVLETGEQSEFTESAQNG